MRTVGGGDAAQPAIVGALSDFFTIEVANESDVLTDLTEFAVSLEYEETTDEIVNAATVVFRRLEGVNSLAPLMTATPPVALGRRIVISHDPGAGFREIFRGRIDDVAWPERFGDVTVECRDQAGVAADTWIEAPIEYSTTAGVDLEDVMQAVADDNLTTSYTLNFPGGATGAVVQHDAGDPPYGPSEQTVLDAERALAESIGYTIRWRHFDASASDWKWTAFAPSRAKTSPDHTFAATDYWNVTQMAQSIEDIRNVVEVEFTQSGGSRASVVVEDAASIALYGRRYMKISEADDSPINRLELATELANAALSDLKDPDALLEIEGPYFWPGEVGVDLYRFSANDKHFSSNQDLAPMSFRHRIAIGERPTTWITTRGKPSGGALMWLRRPSSTTTSELPTTRIINFRETERDDDSATFGWENDGEIEQLWVWLSTEAQPIASDPWPAVNSEPDFRLTSATEEYDVDLPDFGYVTLFQLVAVDAEGNVSKPWRAVIQSQDAPRLHQRATQTAQSTTTVTIRVAVADPQPRNDVTVTHVAQGCTADLTSPQTILAAVVTSDITTTGYKEYVVTRPAFLAGTGRITFTATATDRMTDSDAVDIPCQDGPGPVMDVVGTPGTTTFTVTYTSTGTLDYSVDGAAYTSVPSSPFAVSRNAVGGAAKILTFRCTRNSQTTTSTLVIPPQELSTSLSLSLAAGLADVGASTLDLTWTPSNMPTGTTYNCGYDNGGANVDDTTGLSTTTHQFTSVTFNGSPGKGVIFVNAIYQGAVIATAMRNRVYVT